MRALAAFFLLAARPATFFWLGLGLVTTWILTVATSDPDFPGGRPDQIILGCVLFPALLGIIAGLVLQSLQRCWFAWSLPAVRSRTRLGFAVAGIAGSAAVVAVQPLTVSAHRAVVLLAIAIAAYCLAGLVVDPGRKTLSWLVWGAFAWTWIDSWRIGALILRHPAATVILCVAAIGLVLHLRFSASAFRRLQFRSGSELVGSQTLGDSEEVERERLARYGPLRRDWRNDLSGGSPWRWVGAGLYESFGRLGLRDLPRLLGPTAALAALFALHVARVSAAGASWIEGLLRTLYGGILLSPQMVRSLGGEVDIPWDAVALWTPALSWTFLLVGSTAFDPRRHYPLSRGDLQRVVYRLQLSVAALYGLLVGGAFLALGAVSGRLLGEPLFPGGTPMILRALLATLILLPAAQWIFLRKTARPSELQLPALVFACLLLLVGAFVYSVNVGRWVSGPGVELLLSGSLAVGSQILLYRRLRRFYSAEDLIS